MQGVKYILHSTKKKKKLSEFYNNNNQKKNCPNALKEETWEETC